MFYLRNFIFLGENILCTKFDVKYYRGNYIKVYEFKVGEGKCCGTCEKD